MSKTKLITLFLSILISHSAFSETITIPSNKHWQAYNPAGWSYPGQGSAQFSNFYEACAWAYNSADWSFLRNLSYSVYSFDANSVGATNISCTGVYPDTGGHYAYGAAYIVGTCPAGSSHFSPIYVAGNWPDSSNLCTIDVSYAKDNGLSCNSTNLPINYKTGNKWLSINDIENQLFNLSFTRNYNSALNISGSSLGKWWHSYSKSITFWPTAQPSNAAHALINMPDGKNYHFTRQVSGLWESDNDINEKLIEVLDVNGNRTGWQVINSNDQTESYNASGQLTSIVDKNSYTLTFSYSTQSDISSSIPAENLLTSVSNNFGQFLSFSYQSVSTNNSFSINISKIKDPAGGIHQYAYSTDGYNNLSSVTYPDGTVTTYHYGEVGHVAATPASGVVNANLLTGITDENGHRYANYYYDAKGRAYDENLAGGVEATNLVYNTDGSGNPTSTVVTDSLGNARTHNFTTVLGVVKSTGQSQPAGSGCSAAASTLAYDANGNVATRVDFNGNKTTYVYDLARNLETSRTEGLTTAGATTAATRTITTTWHTTWRLPLVVSEYSGSAGTGTPLKRTTTAYDSKGNITSYTEEDPVRSLSRTTTTTYTYSTAVPGLVLEKVVDGPRTGTSDSTTYTYYPHDATCLASAATPIVDPVTSTSPANLGCRGQLASIVSPVGTTSYDRYNHHGQVEQLTDPNAVITEFTYDLRQRLTSKTTGTESTQFTYDDAGLLTQTKFPDNSELNNVYDNAHRLTEISNTTGDKVVYTLDAVGNRVQEDMYDPNGYLAKSLTRQFDALNRAQQVTGE